MHSEISWRLNCSHKNNRSVHAAVQIFRVSISGFPPRGVYVQSLVADEARILPSSVSVDLQV